MSNKGGLFFRHRVIGDALTEVLRTFPLTYDPSEQFSDLVEAVQLRVTQRVPSFPCPTSMEILSTMAGFYPTLHNATLLWLLSKYEESVGVKIGLTPAEVVVRDLLFEAHRAFIALGEQYSANAQSGGEHHNWTVAMGELQRMVEARPTTRRLRRE